MKAVIYGASWCTYCKAAIRLCESKSIPYEYLSVDDEKVLLEVQGKIGKFKTVPQIFIDDKHVGGFTELNKMLLS